MAATKSKITITVCVMTDKDNWYYRLAAINKVKP